MTKIQIATLAALFIMVAAYIAFLVMIWNQYQMDRSNHRDKIDELLDRLPAKTVTDES